MKSFLKRRSASKGPLVRRNGSVLLLTAFLMIVILALVAFSVDVGFICLTKSQLRNAADSAVLSSAHKLADSFDVKTEEAMNGLLHDAKTAAAEVAALHPNGGLSSTQMNVNRDIRFGTRIWNSQTEKWEEIWGSPPYNLVEVTLRRHAADGTKLPLFFGSVLGTNHANVGATARAAFQTVGGFYLPRGSSAKLMVLPITVDLQSWEYYLGVLAGRKANGSNGFPVLYDKYRCDKKTGQVTTGPDGILEFNIYPDTDNSLPPGNRGTVDLGSPNNSTTDLVRQIREGLNDYDLSFFPNYRISWENGPVIVNGDTGLSAGIKDALNDIQGQTRSIPIFINVYGNGNNAMFEVVKFSGVRVMHSLLTRSPAYKHVLIQPENISEPLSLPGTTPVASDSILTPPRLIQ